jgi:hypothetical protein
MKPILLLVAAAALAAGAANAAPRSGGSWTACPPGLVYRPIGGNGYEAGPASCRPARPVRAAAAPEAAAAERFGRERTEEDRLRMVSGATNMERLKSLTMLPPSMRDNSMGRSTPP